MKFSNVERIVPTTEVGIPILQFGTPEAYELVGAMAPFGFAPGKKLPSPKKFKGLRKRYIRLQRRLANGRKTSTGHLVRLELHYNQSEKLYKLFADGYFVEGWKSPDWRYKVLWTSTDGENWSDPDLIETYQTRDGQERTIGEYAVRPKWIGAQLCTDLFETEAGNAVCLPYILAFDGQKYVEDLKIRRYLHAFFPDGTLVPSKDPSVPNSVYFDLQLDELPLIQRFEILRYTLADGYHFLIKGTHDAETLTKIWNAKVALEAGDYHTAGELLGSEWVTEFGNCLLLQEQQGYDDEKLVSAAKLLREKHYGEAGKLIGSEWLQTEGQQFDEAAIAVAAELLDAGKLQEAGAALRSEWLGEYAKFLKLVEEWQFDDGTTIAEAIKLIGKGDDYDDMLAAAMALYATGLVEPGRLIVDSFRKGRRGRDGQYRGDFWPMAVGHCLDSARLEAEGDGSWDARPLPPKVLREPLGRLTVNNVGDVVDTEERDDENEGIEKTTVTSSPEADATEDDAAEAKADAAPTEAVTA